MDNGGNNRESPSKRRMMTDDDRNNNRNRSSVHSSSVNQVMFNDDLLIEILIRLPVISVLFFKSVSKRWLSLITSPAFLNLHVSRFPNIHPPSGLFLQKTNNTHDHFQHDFVSWDNRIAPCKKKSPFTFGSDASNVEVLQSCNGLVLCVVRTSWTDKIYVYNPSLNMFKILPRVHGLKFGKFSTRMRLSFDPTKSPHYKVLHIQQSAHGGSYSIQPQIYSSEKGCWIIGDTFPVSWYGGHFNMGVCWNDAIHWFDHLNRVRHFKLDVEHPPDTTTELPEILDGNNSYKKLFESRGCLLFACAGFPHPRSLKIYEMRNGYCGWSMRYTVNLEDSIEAFIKTRNMSTIGFRFNVVFMVVGEREEESYVVMKLCGMAVKYNLLLKTIHPLCDIGNIHLTEFCTFPFIASFAAV